MLERIGRFDQERAAGVEGSRTTDLGPECRQPAVELRRFLGGELQTGIGEFLGGQVPQGAVRTGLVAVGAQRRDDLLRVGDVRDLCDVQTLVPQLAVNNSM